MGHGSRSFTPLGLNEKITAIMFGICQGLCTKLRWLPQRTKAITSLRRDLPEWQVAFESKPQARLPQSPKGNVKILHLGWRHACPYHTHTRARRVSGMKWLLIHVHVVTRHGKFVNWSISWSLPRSSCGLLRGPIKDWQKRLYKIYLSLCQFAWHQKIFFNTMHTMQILWCVTWITPIDGIKTSLFCKSIIVHIFI